MCDSENIQTLQRGMNFRINPSYSVILMSQRANAPYHDRVYEDGITIEYEGHDVPKRSYNQNPKHEDQPEKLPSLALTCSAEIQYAGSRRLAVLLSAS